ncbi:hypothetical protein LLH00_08575 [bacterium]|nr:hypothetical protein [bacterium]
MSKKLFLPILFLLLLQSRWLAGQEPFHSARPVWPAGCDTSMNLTAGFRAVFESGGTERTVLRLAASSMYRFYVNGAFAGHGPSRGPHGWRRVDEWDITRLLAPGENTLALEVTGYNINSYYLLDQPAFLQAEVVSEGRVLASTAGAGVNFEAAVLPQRVRSVQRYSFQRAFSEVYRLSPDFSAWRTDSRARFDRAELALSTPKKLLPCRTALPCFELRQPVSLRSTGRFEVGPRPDSLWVDRALTQVGPQIKGFPRSELEDSSFVLMQYVRTIANNALDKPYCPDSSTALRANSFAIFDLGVNLTGFPAVRLSCREATELFFTFDELLTDGDVDFKRLGCVNLVHWRLEPGQYELEAAEPYTMKYLKVMVMQGEAEITGVSLREYANPEASRARFASSDNRLDRLFEAARQTFRQNAVDLFTDCPSRERAGWLCDSYFTARAAQSLCGNSSVEKAFLENFILPDSFSMLPAGMLPMCYPADNRNGSYIPNWAMWFVLELEEYLARSGDRALVEAARPKVTALLDRLGRYRNRDGLLEKLDSWVFVEWSEANDYVQDVNYPTNMLYAAALDAAARLYDLPACAEQAVKVRQVIRKQSYDGTFFVDNAVRVKGVLKPTRNRTETCQDYAFYLGTATPESYPELWKLLVSQFGPQREKSGAWPEVSLSRPFIGNQLRLDILANQGRVAQALEECRDYLLYMADRTGTLWEMQDQRASCNHGFASHCAHFLLRDILGLRRVDTVHKRVTLRLSDPGIEWCEGSLPTPDGEISAAWIKRGGRIEYRVQLPAGYSLSVENNSGLEIRPQF